MANKLIALLTGLVILILLMYGSLSPCSILREKILKEAAQEHSFGGNALQILPDSWVDGLIAAQYGDLTPGRCLGLLIGYNGTTAIGQQTAPQHKAEYSHFIREQTAYDDDTLIAGAKLCTRYLPRHEREYNIPVHLLAAIASIESGRFHQALGLELPWPWTIKVDSVRYYFDKKEDAITAVRAFYQKDFHNISVGCMQINLQHNPKAFNSLNQAFDPEYNVGYEAQLLKHNFEISHSWSDATASIHSNDKDNGQEYARLVFDQWTKIINKVADARAGKPILNTTTTTPVEPPTELHSHPKNMFIFDN